MKSLITKAEVKVLNLFVKGLSSKDIADKLKISANTVRVHFNNIHGKTGIHKAVPLAFWWAKHRGQYENSKEMA